ncbi:MAG: hypothetical protein KDC53_21265, partial [Saprospiraceae bacterium]|nr:hypothetical protein [Saprospiraceae bacterium]
MSSTVYYLGITLFFISCSPKYQIYSLDSDDVKYVRSEYLYEDSVLEFTYDFWADGGTMLYNIFNKSGDSIFINMERSNFRFNQEPFHYYLNQSTGTLAKPDTSNNLSYSPYLDFDPIVTIPPRQDRWFEGFPV